jgi:polyphenol oxidase
MNAPFGSKGLTRNERAETGGADLSSASTLGEQSGLLKRAGFMHVFTGRFAQVGGDSSQVLDFGWTQPDAAYAACRSVLATSLRVNVDQLHEMSQVHGARIVEANGVGRMRSAVEADALIVRASTELAVGVRTADCVPLLIGSVVTGACAAVHAGWKGVVAEIAARTLEQLGEPSDHLVCAIGPCIGSHVFEVGAEVAHRIAKASSADAIVGTRGDKLLVDLRQAVRAQLQAAGVPERQIENVGGCTLTDDTRYHSYRRDGERSGRQIAVIVRKHKRD